MLVPLRVFSTHSFLTSSITADQMISYCKSENIPYAGIANDNSMFGLFKWTQTLTKSSIKTVTGCALKVGNGHVWAYCLNHSGFLELSHLLTDSYLHHEGVLQAQNIHLKNCILLCDLSSSLEEIAILSRHNQVTIAISRQQRDAKDENDLFKISNLLKLPIVAAPKYFFHRKEMQLETDCLWCIKNNTYVQEDDRETVYDDEYFKPQAEYEEVFSDIPWAIKNSELLAQKCNFQMEPTPPRMPKTGSENPRELFKKNVYSGFEKKLQNSLLFNIATKDQSTAKQILEERLSYEISVITKMDFCEYFLIVSEIVQWSKNNNIMVGPGRGSGAGSLVAYCLEITSINPIRFNLMFERFLNPDRISLPDFDIDFCQQNRHLVINFIKDRFGEECVAHIITFGSLQYRAALRDIGRVIQLPYSMVDNLCKKLPAPFQGVAPTLKELREKKISTEFINSENEQLFRLAENIEGLPRHASMHAAGIIITNTKIANICPLYKEPDVEMPIIQLDMKEAEAIGLVKFDILGLTMLSTLSQTLTFLKKKNVIINLENLELTDKNIFKMITKGYTNSLFQIDSPGMRQVLKEMKPDCFEDIIATTSLYRPGPMAEIPRFIASKNGSLPIVYDYPELEPILKETYGVTVYQEQVLEIAKVLAGYSLKEADLLRRAMGKKNHEEMEKNKKQFVAGVLKNCQGSEEKAEQFFDNLASFASYGFNKAHATCYSMITYQTAYLKYYHTIEFLCSSMIFEIHLDKLADMIQEAINFGITLMPPDINMSNFNFDIIDNKIYYGLTKVKGVGETAHLIIEERDKNGHFSDLRNFITRVSPNKRALESLILAGAFDRLDPDRAKLLNEMKDKASHNISLFDDLDDNQTTPFSEIEKAVTEFEKLGYIFSQKILEINLKKFKIFNSIEDIERVGIIHALGIKPIIKNTKDGKKIFAYEFFEKKGVHRLFANNFFDFRMETLMFEVEKMPNRFIIRNIIPTKEYLQKFKKVFLDIKCKLNLAPGNTSLYVQQQDTPLFLGNFELNLGFLEEFEPHILSLH